MAYIISRLKDIGVLCALLVVGACTGETGIIVEVTSLKAIDSLTFVVATRHGGVDGVWVRDQMSSGSAVDLAGRDLSVDPYTLRLHDGTDAGTPSEVMVGVFGKNAGVAVAFAGFDVPQRFVSGKVVKRELELEAIADVPVEVDLETGCVRWVTTKGEVIIGSEMDNDCDGTPNVDDCGPTDPDVGPESPEVCENGIDDNCNGLIDENIDSDVDGVFSCQGDCDDTRGDVYPNAPETCDSVDNNCDGLCDEGYDEDGDRYTSCGSKDIGDGKCAIVPVDCLPADANSFPGADELCDGVDNNCNGQCDEGHDGDTDGYTWCGTVDLGPTCATAAYDDCNDGDPAIHPGADDVCDGIDTDCDGATSISMPCYERTDVQGSFVCKLGTSVCSDDVSGGSVGACLPDLDDTSIVDDALCAAYKTCVDDGDHNPFVCATDQRTNRTGNCTVFYGPGYTLCGERLAPLPSTIGAMLCEWQILGGEMQAHYKVLLWDETIPPSARLDSCNASLQLADSLDIVPQFDVVYVTTRENAVAGSLLTYELHIKPEEVLTCPISGFVCNF